MEGQHHIVDIAKSIGYGLITSLMITIGFSAMAALVFLVTGCGQNAIYDSVIAICVAAAFCGGFIAGHRLKYRKFLWGFIVGLLYFTILFAVSIQSENIASIPVLPVLICAGGSTLGGMFG